MFFAYAWLLTIQRMVLPI